MTKPLKAKLRKTNLDEAIEITKFLVDLGLSMPKINSKIISHWSALWKTNPSLKHYNTEPDLGWVLEDENRLVGFFGNIPQVSYFQGSIVRVSSARAWAVNKSYRDQTNQLCEAFFKQTNADVVLISSANAPAGKRCLEFGASPIPQQDYENILFWVLNADSFLQAGLKKKGYGKITSSAGGLFGSIALNAKMRIGGRRPFSVLDNIIIKKIDEIDHSFDILWGKKLIESPDQFLACRNAETLRWYFKLSQAFHETRIICHINEAGLNGYAILVREDVSDIGLKRLKISDFFVSKNNPSVIDALLTASYEYGIATSCDVLEVIGLDQSLRRQVLKHKPFSRPMPVFPFYFKALKEELQAPLSKNECWSATAFDGDTALL